MIQQNYYPDKVLVKREHVLKKEIENLGESIKNASVYHIDINYFKEFYDKFGPRQKNAILDFFNTLLRKNSLYCARNGEGEFIAVIEHREKDYAKKLKEGLEHLVLSDTGGYEKKEIEINNKIIELDPTRVTVRIGVAPYNGNLEDTLKRAKKAKDLAKNKVDQVYIFE